MIAQINRIKILKFNYEPDNIFTGTHNGIKWRLLEKKQINNKLCGYVFLITYSDNISCNKTLITKDINIWAAAKMTIEKQYYGDS